MSPDHLAVKKYRVPQKVDNTEDRRDPMATFAEGGMVDMSMEPGVKVSLQESLLLQP